MRKTFLILLLGLWPALAHAQSITTVAGAIKGGATLPATCRPATTGSRADVFIKTGASSGLYTCSAANTWTAVGGGGSGDVVGPASSTDNAVARFDLATGKLIQNSVVLIDDSGNVTGLGTLNSKTLPTGTDTLAGLGTAQTFTANQTYGSGILRATSPRVTTGLADANGAAILDLSPTASAVNRIQLNNAATGNSPGFTTVGGDTNIGVTFTQKGTANFSIIDGNSNTFAFEASQRRFALYFGAEANPRIAISNTAIMAGPGTTNPVDVYFRRGTTSNWVMGTGDSATPLAYTLTIGESSRGGTDTNVAGANGIIRPGNGTGSAGSGAFKIQVAPPGGSGTTADTYADALSISNAKVATFSGDIQGTTATFSGAINVGSCTGCGSGTTINASGQGIYVPDVIYDADSFEGVATGNDVKFYRFINPIAVTADRADLKGVVAQASGKFSFSLRSWDCTTTTYFDSGVMDTTSWSNVDVTQTLSSGTLPAGGICLMWTHDNTTSKTRTVGPQANTMQIMNIPANKRLGTCSNTSSAGVLPASCGTQTASNTQGIFQFTLRKN